MNKEIANTCLSIFVHRCKQYKESYRHLLVKGKDFSQIDNTSLDTLVQKLDTLTTQSNNLDWDYTEKFFLLSRDWLTVQLMNQNFEAARAEYNSILSEVEPESPFFPPIAPPFSFPSEDSVAASDNPSQSDDE